MATLGINEIILVLLDRLKGLTGGVDGLGGIPALSVGAPDLGGARAYHLVVWGLALVVFVMATERLQVACRAVAASAPSV